ncbi:MAG: hypothetical protein FWF27_04580 [Candidatus Bathyarchaeota archaeon]|nr:hypothetical protein [Candidatus Termiticorpusculum sp.]
MTEAVFTTKDKATLEALAEELPKLKEKMSKLVEYIESLEETLEILSDKETMQDLKESEEDIKEGRVYTWEEALKELKIDEKDLAKTDFNKKST